MLDDAFISFRYAANLAAGNGLVYNPGEHVEGYTSFLWVILLGLGRAVHLDIVLLAQVLGFAFAVTLILLISFSHKFIAGMPPRESCTAAILLGTCGVFTPWARSGMETTLFALVLTCALLIHLITRERPSRGGTAIAAAACAVCALTRPEGLLVVLAIGMDRARSGRRRSLPVFSFVFLLLYAPYFVWRWHYYGYLFPNTFYAKVGFTAAQLWRGLGYLTGFLRPALLMAVAIFFGLITPRGRKVIGGPMAAVLVLYIGFVVAVGGDAMPAFRFFAPVVPLVAILAARSLGTIQRRLAMPMALIIIASYGIGQWWTDPQIYDHIRNDRVAYFGKQAGLYMKSLLPPGSLIATNTAGSIPYYSELPSIDMLGLNDLTIAHRQIHDMGSHTAGHEKGDGSYVLSRRPLVIQFGSALGRTSPMFRGDVEIYNDPRFWRDYRPASFSLPTGQRLILYVRKAPDGDGRERLGRSRGS